MKNCRIAVLVFLIACVAPFASSQILGVGVDDIEAIVVEAKPAALACTGIATSSGLDGALVVRNTSEDIIYRVEVSISAFSPDVPLIGPVQCVPDTPFPECRWTRTSIPAILTEAGTSESWSRVGYQQPATCHGGSPQSSGNACDNLSADCTVGGGGFCVVVDSAKVLVTDYCDLNDDCSNNGPDDLTGSGWSILDANKNVLCDGSDLGTGNCPVEDCCVNGDCHNPVWSTTFYDYAFEESAP